MHAPLVIGGARTSFILLLGAGFSRNWGGWPASEAFEYLLGCPQVDEDIRNLGQLKQLNHVSLAHTQVTEACLDILGNIKSLQSINLDSTVVSDEALTGFEAHTGIRTIK